MKKLSVLIVVAILGIVLWALPAGAEKVRMSDSELDGIAAGIPGVKLNIPPPSPVACCVNLFLAALGLPKPPLGDLSLNLTTIPMNPTIKSNVVLSATGMVPGSLLVGGSISGPKGISVPIPGFFLPIP